jgi:hypothetical protein
VGDLLLKLQYVEDHPEVADAYRRRAPERIRERYDWQKVADLYEEFFLRMAAGENATLTHSSVANQPVVRGRTEAFLAATSSGDKKVQSGKIQAPD